MTLLELAEPITGLNSSYQEGVITLGPIVIDTNPEDYQDDYYDEDYQDDDDDS